MKERVGDGKLIGLIISTTVSGTNDRIVLQIRAQGPDLQNILRQSYDYLTTVPKLRSTYDGRLIYTASYNEWKAFHRYCKIHVQNCNIVGDSVRKLAYDIPERNFSTF